MRKLLLATTAMLSGGLVLANTASAQVKLNDGTAYTTPFAIGGGMGTENSQPGNIVVHFNGRFSSYFGAFFDQGANGNINNAGAKAVMPSGVYKQNVTAMGDNVRLYPGFDGVAANGLQYGVMLEFRNDQKNPSGYGGGAGATTGNVGLVNSNVLGVANPGTTIYNDVSARTRDSLYTYQSWGYVGTPSAGIFRFGMMPPSNGMLLVGTMENFNDGGWHGTQSNGGLLGVSWPMIDNGIVASADGIQYLSPQLYGFDFSATFQPTGAGGNMWAGCDFGIAGTGCSRLTTSSNPNDARRRTDWFDIAARYRGTFGPVGVAAQIGYVQAGVMKYSGAITGVQSATGGSYTNTLTGAAGTIAPLNAYSTYKPLKEGIIGGTASFAGAMIGGHAEWGDGDFQQQLTPVAGKRYSAIIGGATYTMGAATFGAQYLYVHAPTAMSSSAIHMRTSQGPYVGAQYIVAPGMMTYVGYQYSMLHQMGLDFVQNGAGTANNTVHSSYLAAGTVFSW